MEVANKEAEFIKKLEKTPKNASKALPRFFKYIGKIKNVSQYDDYLKNNIKVPLIIWGVDYLLIKPFLLFLAFLCLSAIWLYYPPGIIFLLAEGTSLSWYLLTELKRDIFRKEA